MMSYDLVLDLRNKYVQFEFIIIGLTIKCPDQKQKVRRLNGDKNYVVCIHKSTSYIEFVQLRPQKTISFTYISC